MNLQTRYPTTADEFLRWNEGREGKWEFVRGRVVELMMNVTKTEMFVGLDEVVHLPDLNVQIPLAELYDGVDIKPAS